MLRTVDGVVVDAKEHAKRCGGIFRKMNRLPERLMGNLSARVDLLASWQRHQSDIRAEWFAVPNDLPRQPRQARNVSASGVDVGPGGHEIAHPRRLCVNPVELGE